ncbi:MAG: hypothetical protein O3A51_05495 [Verrucomicrobia bacterium]|nr:hypothetical protein [Verrucomicrobiota bacterium]
MRYQLARFMIIIGVGGLTAISNASAQESADFDENIDYHILIQVHDYEVETIKDVNVIGIERIDDKVFLAIKGTSFGAKKTGYILLSTVKAILPVGVERETRPLIQRPNETRRRE